MVNVCGGRTVGEEVLDCVVVMVGVSVGVDPPQAASKEITTKKLAMLKADRCRGIVALPGVGFMDAIIQQSALH
jgi:hypothetical protein